MTQKISLPQDMDEDTIFELTEIVDSEEKEEETKVQPSDFPESSTPEPAIFLDDQNLNLEMEDPEYSPRLEDLIDNLTPPSTEADKTSETSTNDFDSMLDDLLDKKASPDESAISAVISTDAQEQNDPASKKAAHELDSIDADDFSAHADLANLLQDNLLDPEIIDADDLPEENSPDSEDIDLNYLLEETFVESDNAANEIYEAVTVGTLNAGESGHKALNVSALLAAAENELHQLNSKEVTDKSLTTLVSIKESLDAITERLDSFNAYFSATHNLELQDSEIHTAESLDLFSARLTDIEARLASFDMESVTKHLLQEMQPNIEKAAAAAAASILREEIQILFETMTDEEAPTDNS